MNLGMLWVRDWGTSSLHFRGDELYEFRQEEEHHEEAATDGDDGTGDRGLGQILGHLAINIKPAKPRERFHVNVRF